MSVQLRLFVAAAVLLSFATLWTSAADDVVVQIQSNAARSGAYVRDEVDPQDPVERFALLLPGGPLIVEATMTLEGKPFRAAREALIDEILSAGDTDKDGVITWDEALRNPDFTCGRIFPEQQRAQYVKMLDGDENGTVDRAEARRFLAAVFQGPAFLVSGGFADRRSALISVNDRLMLAGGGPADVWGLLDTDSDGVLSKPEIADAGERLKGRDGDDNDLLYTAEIGGASSNYRTQRERYAAQQHAILLGPAVRAGDLFVAIRDKYQAEGGVLVRGSFPAVPELFDRLDTDRNGVLSEDEVMRLNRVEPHVRLIVDLKRGEGESTLSLTYLDGGQQRPDDTEGAASIELPGVTVRFAVSTAATGTRNYDMTAQRMLDQYDSDGNEYLELKELPPAFGPQFDLWDGDGDGKVFKQEIADFSKRSQRPQQTQVQASVVPTGDALLPALDLSGDSRLSLREMKTAQVQLASLDRDGDGRLTREEVPVSYTVTFRNGQRPGNFRVVQFAGGGRRPVQPPTGDGPAWFLRMDRNGDGDVTLKEFLGDRDNFEALDTNSDGFIETAEAKAASPTDGAEK